MAYALTSEQVRQVVQNTVLVMLARSDLLPDWRANLGDLVQQMRAAALDDEAIFLAAVLALLDCPTDNLPTGTQYDQAWQSIVTGLQTGALPSEREEMVTLDRLLGSIVQAISAVQSRASDQRQAVSEELLNIKTAALEAEVPELVVWIDDALDVLDGAAAAGRAHHHAGVYGIYWQAIIDNSPSS